MPSGIGRFLGTSGGGGGSDDDEDNGSQDQNNGGDDGDVADVDSAADLPAYSASDSGGGDTPSLSEQIQSATGTGGSGGGSGGGGGGSDDGGLTESQIDKVDPLSGSGGGEMPSLSEQIRSATGTGDSGGGSGGGAGGSGGSGDGGSAIDGSSINRGGPKPDVSDGGVGASAIDDVGISGFSGGGGSAMDPSETPAAATVDDNNDGGSAIDGSSINRGGPKPDLSEDSRDDSEPVPGAGGPNPSGGPGASAIDDVGIAGVSGSDGASGSASEPVPGAGGPNPSQPGTSDSGQTDTGTDQDGVPGALYTGSSADTTGRTAPDPDDGQPLNQGSAQRESINLVVTVERPRGGSNQEVTVEVRTAGGEVFTKTTQTGRAVEFSIRSAAPMALEVSALGATQVVGPFEPGSRQHQVVLSPGGGRGTGTGTGGSGSGSGGGNSGGSSGGSGSNESLRRRIQQLRAAIGRTRRTAAANTGGKEITVVRRGSSEEQSGGLLGTASQFVSENPATAAVGGLGLVAALYYVYVVR